LKIKEKATVILKKVHPKKKVNGKYILVVKESFLVFPALPLPYKRSF
jgi:hypothetical protein